jgi:dihydroorotase
MEGKGKLLDGYDADMVLVDMESKRSISDSETWTKVGWSAFEGMGLTGWPVSTFVDGRMVFKREVGGPNRGAFLVEPGSTGKSLRFLR